MELAIRMKSLGKMVMIFCCNDDEDTLAGGAGNDFLIGHDGADKLYGGFGDDVLIAHLLGDVNSSASHELYGGPDDDTSVDPMGMTRSLAEH